MTRLSDFPPAVRAEAHADRRAALPADPDEAILGAQAALRAGAALNLDHPLDDARALLACTHAVLERSPGREFHEEQMQAACRACELTEDLLDAHCAAVTDAPERLHVAITK